MKTFACIGAGLAAALIGAAAWGALAYFAGIEAGMLAWAIGLLVGGAFFLVGQRRGSVGRGVLAACIAILGIGAGKFGAAFAEADRYVQEQKQTVTVEDVAIASIADDVQTEAEASGAVFGEDDLNAQGYPPVVWSKAQAQWAALGEDDRAQRLAEAQQVMSFGEAVATPVLAVGMFVASLFSLWNILWGVLAIGSAYRLARVNNEPELSQAVTSTEEAPSTVGYGSPLSRIATGPTTGRVIHDDPFQPEKGQNEQRDAA
jgi:hypothetical protein